MATQPQADAYGLLAGKSSGGGGGGGQLTGTSGSSEGSQSSNSSENNSSNTNSNSSTNSSSTTKSSSRTQNMDSGSLAALQRLIAQLAGGGTQAMAEDKARKLLEIRTLEAQRAGYSKENAFADAKGAMAKTLRESLEKTLPSINAAALGAGSSQNSMRALLTQKAALQASENSAALGLNAAFNYGNISNGTSQVLSSLINTPDPAMNALLNALGISKGAVTTTSGTQTTTGNQTTTGSQSTTGTSDKSSSGTSSNNENKGMTYGGAPSFIAPQTGGGGTSYYGPPPGIVQRGDTIYDNGAPVYNYGNSQASILRDIVAGASGNNQYTF